MKTTLTVDADYVKIMKDLTKEFEFETQQEFFNCMVLYFKETGINPKTKTKSTAEELSKLRTTVISFIREQEKTKLDPIILKLNETFDFLLNYYKHEAITKEDIKALSNPVIQKAQSTPLPVSKIENQEVQNEKYQNLTKHVKGLFNEFCKNFKSSTFGGFLVDKAVVERYKSMFEKL